MNVRVPPVTYTCAARNKGQTRCHAAAVGSTVAILAQGTSRALASQQAFCVVRFPELSNRQGKLACLWGSSGPVGTMQK